LVVGGGGGKGGGKGGGGGGKDFCPRINLGSGHGQEGENAGRGRKRHCETKKKGHGINKSALKTQGRNMTQELHQEGRRLRTKKKMIAS